MVQSCTGFVSQSLSQYPIHPMMALHKKKMKMEKKTKKCGTPMRWADDIAEKQNDSLFIRIRRILLKMFGHRVYKVHNQLCLLRRTNFVM